MHTNMLHDGGVRCFQWFCFVTTFPPISSVPVSVSWAERQYFYQTNASSWGSARQHCQVCYTEMATVTADNILLLLQSFGPNRTAAWVGLRRKLNDSGIQPTMNSSNSMLGSSMPSTMFQAEKDPLQIPLTTMVSHLWPSAQTSVVTGTKCLA
uniref:C-type lectin domain-containing protein n=1 Tax=Denticeps clupeoides TaxID=299321 RepID=A0AAY4AUP9_9TELE